MQALLAVGTNALFTWQALLAARKEAERPMFQPMLGPDLYERPTWTLVTLIRCSLLTFAGGSIAGDPPLAQSSPFYLMTCQKQCSRQIVEASDLGYVQILRGAYRPTGIGTPIYSRISGLKTISERIPSHGAL